MSPNYSSLAYDDVKEQENEQENCFEPQLTVIVNMRNRKVKSSPSLERDVVQVQGRITVSF